MREFWSSNVNMNVLYLECLTSIFQFKFFTVWFSHMMSWIVVICFKNVNCFPSSTWHIYFEARYTVLVLSVWVWNNYVQLAIDSVLLVRCRMLSFGGLTTTLKEILYKGHGQLLPELDMTHWLEFFPCTFLCRGCFYLLLQFLYPKE